MTDPRLTPRQRDVLELLVQGNDRPSIAAALALSPHTVNHLIEAVSRAHGAPGTTALVARVLGERLRACEATLAAIDRRRGDGG